MHCVMQEAGEWYEYQLRGLSDPLSFQASPRPGPSSQVSFVVYGDMGESDHARAKSPGYTYLPFPPRNLVTGHVRADRMAVSARACWFNLLNSGATACDVIRQNCRIGGQSC